MSKYLDENGLLYYNQKLKENLANKVDKVTGKGLSTNDLTDDLKQKILDAGSSSFNGSYTNLTDKPSINSVTVNGAMSLSDLGIKQVASSGSYNDLSDKPTIPTVNNATLTIQKNGSTVKTFTANASSNVTANITVPTNNNELTNGAGYQTSSEVQALINSSISGFTSIDFQIVETLPATGVKGTIYLVPNSGTGNNVYDEYIYTNNSFEKIGTTDVDLSGYLQISSTITNADIDTIVAS